MDFEVGDIVRVDNNNGTYWKVIQIGPGNYPLISCEMALAANGKPGKAKKTHYFYGVQCNKLTKSWAAEQKAKAIEYWDNVMEIAHDEGVSKNNTT